MSLNKKVLAAAIVGALFAAGNAAAVDFTQTTPVAGKFAKEIKTVANATNATEFSGAGVDVVWESGYAYSPGEVRYVRVEAPAHVLFQDTTTVTASGGTGGLTPGSINGVGTNVITFSVTADAGDPTAVPVVPGGATTDVKFTLDVVAKLTAIADADIKVSLYDQPSQAQAGGTTGLIAGGSVSGKYITFADSLKWVGTAATVVSNVEASPSFTQFTAVTSTDAAAPFNSARLSASFGLDDNDTLAADSSALAVGDLIDISAGKSSVTLSGDFSYVASSGASPFNAAAEGRVKAFGKTAAGELDANSATFELDTALAGDFTVDKLTDATWNPAIPATAYTAKLNAVSADPTTYNLPVLADRAVGAIVRNGTELQAPLAQIPDGWYSRVILTNTSSTARPYTISVMTEKDVTVTTGTLTGTIPANGTKVIDDVKDIFTGHNRATLNVSVAGPNNAIQGMYQIVNPTSGSISNETMVRPGSN